MATNSAFFLSFSLKTGKEKFYRIICWDSTWEMQKYHGIDTHASAELKQT